MRRRSGRQPRAWYNFGLNTPQEGALCRCTNIECTKCKKRTEKIESVAGPHLKKCPHCGGKVERLQSAPAIQFKGSGWYVTDYAGKKPAADSAPSEKSDPKETSEAKNCLQGIQLEGSGSKESKEKKPAKKKD